MDNASGGGIFGQSDLYLFKKTFVLSGTPVEALLRISAEARYKLFVNGQRAAFGPCRPSAEEKYYDTVDISAYLREGENQIDCEVLSLSDNSDMGKPRVIYGVRRTGNLALAVELNCKTADGAVARVGADDTWETCVSPYTSFQTRHPGLNATMFEEDAHNGTPNWMLAKKLMPVHSPRENPYFYGIVNDLFVRPRPIPMMYQLDVPFADTGDGYYIADELTFGFPKLSFEGHGKVKVTYAEIIQERRRKEAQARQNTLVQRRDRCYRSGWKRYI